MHPHAAMLDAEDNGTFVVRIGDAALLLHATPQTQHPDHDLDDNDHECPCDMDLRVVPIQTNMNEATKTLGSSSSPSGFVS